MQCASSTMSPTRLERYLVEHSIILHSVVQNSDSGDIKTIWYSPFLIAHFTCLSSPPANVAFNPFLVYLAIWSSIIDSNGDTTNTIDFCFTFLKLSNTRGSIAKQRDFPYPVGREINTSIPPTKDDSASSCSAFSSLYPRAQAACSSTDDKDAEGGGAVRDASWKLWKRCSYIRHKQDTHANDWILDNAHHKNTTGDLIGCSNILDARTNSRQSIHQTSILHTGVARARLTTWGTLRSTAHK